MTNESKHQPAPASPNGTPMTYSLISECPNCRNGIMPPATLRQLLALSERAVMAEADAHFCACSAGQQMRAFFGRKLAQWDAELEHAERINQQHRTTVEARERERMEIHIREAAIPTIFARPHNHTNGNVSCRRKEKQNGIIAAKALIENGEVKTQRGTKNSLYLWSEKNGTGKTTLATIIYEAWVRAGATGMWTRFSDLLFQIRSRYKTDTAAALIQRAQEVDVLLIDELGYDGREDPTDHTREIFHQIIYARHDWRRRTLFTSNYTPDEMKAKYEERHWQRIGEMCAIVPFGGKALRPF